jgi:outer membrane protein assembly factor BamD
MRLIFAFLFIISSFACNSFAKVQKSSDYDYKLRMAEQYYAKQKYNYAQQLYEEMFPVLKGTDRFEDVYYKYAYCAYYQEDYMNAENLFKGFTEVFPLSKRAEEMEYMRAYSYYRQSPKIELDQTNTFRAMNLMQTFINTHPGSPKNKEASDIIDLCRLKLEKKEEQAAALYFNVGQFKAAALAYGTLMANFPESVQSDAYKIQMIKSYFQYANESVDEKKEERYEQVITECNDFIDRFPESKLVKEVEKYLNLSQNNIKAIKNEQVKKTA